LRRRRRSKNPNVPIGTRRSMRQLSRGTLHIVDEPEIQDENNTSSDDGEESDPNYQESPPHGTRGVVDKLGAAAAVVAMGLAVVVLNPMKKRKRNKRYSRPVSHSL